MKTATFYSYLPKRYTANDAHTERIRRFIYSFKRGDRHAVDFAINIVSECLNKWYGASNQDYVLVCIPAATSAKYNRRFKRFAEEVSKRTGIQNGTAHVNIFGIREAKHNNATTLTLIHNHPSGNPCPSRDDDRITATLKQACSTMRLYLIDHVVVTDSTYYSYSEEGKL